MSTVADYLPYMQAWLDARAAQVQPIADYNAAKTAMATARTAVATRVQAGDTAIQMTPQVTAYANARTTYLQTDAAQRAAVEKTQQAFLVSEAMMELLCTGGTIPPYAASPGGLSGGGTGTGIELVTEPEPEAVVEPEPAPES